MKMPWLEAHRNLALYFLYEQQFSILQFSVHTFKMVIIVSAPKGEEELRTGPKWLKVEHFVGRMGGTLAHGTWFRLPISLQQLGSNH